jgi:hypothetical protein
MRGMAAAVRAPYSAKETTMLKISSVTARTGTLLLGALPVDVRALADSRLPTGLTEE